MKDINKEQIQQQSDIQVAKDEKQQDDTIYISQWEVLRAYSTICMTCAILAFILIHSIITGVYFRSDVSFYGIHFYALCNGIKIAVILFIFVMRQVVFKVSGKKTIDIKKRNKMLSIEQIVTFLILIFLSVDLAIFMRQFNDINYGPITIINGNKTQIHWYTKGKSPSIVNVGSQVINDSKLTRFHNVLVDSQDFTYSVQDITTAQASYSLPSTIRKFVVMTDIHRNSKYMKSMDQDYDFNLLNGDYSSGGMAHEFSQTFRDIHQKPIILAVGNHDILTGGEVDKLILREPYFYQKIGQLGFYFIQVLNTNNIINSQWINKTKVDEAMKFLNENMHLSQNDEHVFIVSHQSVYSTGEYGSPEYFTKKMEEFLDSHHTSKIRAVLSGHDHIFASFKRNNQFFFVNGAGGGAIDHMLDFGKRSWSSPELSGPMPVINSKTLGYDHHLKSYMKFTRTEITFENGNVQYRVRDLEANTILTTFEQTIQ
ncbi:Alkaline_phosphatase [Hexamita inflata]|uniref:Alkaline phosphatase n=1 Tax=Hexamita inflata TaxID=28002 RepID=A0AA86QF98_9EUKA|nr:Alkaline phosphatase [Hexamita inflata]